MIDEEKLKKWLEVNVIGNCKYGDEWKDKMRRELNDAFERLPVSKEDKDYDN